MTCIVGVVDSSVHRVWIGGDSWADNGWVGEVRADRKVFILPEHEMAIGFTTSYRMGQLVRYRLHLRPQEFKPDIDLDERWRQVEEWLVTRFVEAVRKTFKDGGYLKKENEREEGGQFLIGYQGQLWQMHDDFQIARSAAGYDAVGSGHEVALGAIHAISREGLPVGYAPEGKVRAALDAAVAFSAHVRGPYHLISAAPTMVVG